MAAMISEIKTMLRTGTGIGTCFGAEPTRTEPHSAESELPPEEKERREEAAQDLLDDFKW
jgi:hypothetical protein